MAALRAKLVAMQWNAAALFERVELFDLRDLEPALDEVLSFSNRICCVIHERTVYENFKEGQVLRTRRIRHVTLLMSDRVYANRQSALAGTVTTPGIYAIADQVDEAVAGLLMPGCYVRPVSGESVELRDAKRADLPGRECWTLSLDLVGGQTVRNLGTQPIP